MNHNYHTTNEEHHYLLQPGDGTAYRFSFQYYPEGIMDVDGYPAHKANVLDSGVGDGSNYVRISINMPGGSGIGCVMRNPLSCFGTEGDTLTGYLKSHGLGNVNDYTLVAVLFAVKVLVNDPEDLLDATAEMLKARTFNYG